MDPRVTKDVGRIRKFFADFGYGFIEIAGEQDIHFLKKDARYEAIRPGDIVLFELRFDAAARPMAHGVEKTELQLELSNWREVQVAHRTSRQVLQKSAEESQREGNYGRARQKYHEAIKHDLWEGKRPDETIFVSYGDMEKRLERPKEAKEIYSLGISYYPGSSKLISRAAKLSCEGGKHDEAFKLLTRFIHSYPPDEDIRAQLVDVLLYLSEEDPSQYLGRAESESRLLRERKHKDAIDGRLRMLKDESSRLLWVLLRSAGFELFTCKVESHDDIPLFGYILTRPDRQMREKYGFNKQLFIYHSFEPIPQATAITKGIELFNAYKVGKEEQIHQRVFLMMVSSIDEVREFLKKLREDPETNPTIVPVCLPEARDAIARHGANEYIATLFDEWMSQIDRYRENYPVQGRDFFGRERDLVALNKNLEAGKPTGIFGLRKVGKTSILYQLANIRTKDLVAYIDAQSSTVADCKYILWETVNKWIESEKKHGEKERSGKVSPLKMRLSASNYPTAEDLPGFGRTLQLFDEDVRTLISAKPPVVKLILFIDEIELLTPSSDNRSGWTGALETFRYLRGASQSTSKRLVPIIAGANPRICEAPSWDNQDNPVFQFFEEVFIPLLPETDCKELVVKIGELMNVTYNAAALDLIYKAVGGHPFFTRRLCSHIINLYPDRPLQVTCHMVDEAQEEFLIKEDALFTEIVYRLERDFPDELEILKWVARKGDLKELKALIGTWNTSIKHLEGYQMLERIRKPALTLRIKIELFEKWLQEA